MRRIFKLSIATLFVILSQVTIIIAQPDVKIEKKLSKLFITGKLEKCQKVARKMNSKYPKSYLPEYYLSKVDVEFFINSSSSTASWKYIKSASKQSERLPEKYGAWKLKVQNVMAQYIFDEHDSSKLIRRVKVALQFYTKSYNDTLELYAFYHPEYVNIKSTYNQDIIPDTDSLRRVLLINAKELVGIRYVYAGETPSSGFDCSGFTRYVYSTIGVELPHNAQMQSLLEGENIAIEDAQPGDLIFFGYANENTHHTSHAGIFFSGSNDEPKVIHCVSGGVSIDGNNTSWDLYWKQKILFVKRLSVFSN